MWIIYLLLSFLFQYCKTLVILLDKPHLFTLSSPTIQGFHLAFEDALNAKLVPVLISQARIFYYRLSLSLRIPFLYLRSHPFLSSLNLLFLASIIFNNLNIWLISILAFLLTFTAKLLKNISLLLRHCSPFWTGFSYQNFTKEVLANVTIGLYIKRDIGCFSVFFGLSGI